MKKLKALFLSELIAVSAVASVFSASGFSACCADMDSVAEPISRNVPAYSEGNSYGANDEHYFTFWNSSTPDYIAYDLSGVPEKQRKTVAAVWYNISSFDRIGMYQSRNAEPTDYTIEVNSAEGGEFPETGWEIIETVEGNTLSSRQHIIDMEGYNWIRLNISKADDEAGKNASVNFDVHEAENGVSDSWLFLGDSITAGGMNNCYGTGFATLINEIDSRYFPIQENGGIGGIRSVEGRENIDRWLSVSCAKYVSIAYGTNDCWGNPDNTESYYENTKYMIDAVLEAGKIPVLPKIPASVNADVKDNVPLYNAVIDRLYEEYGDKLIQGPDFEAVFTENPEYLSGDGVHPSDTGYAAMRQIWAETMYERVYKLSGDKQPSTEPVATSTTESAATTTAESITTQITTTSTETTTESTRTLYGDANCDGEISVADATLILQYCGNKDKYTLQEQGLINADVDGTAGISAVDALTIQRYDAKQIDKLPAD
ncbi:MAG: lysophospholipase [Ruminococcus sp.]|nr:lysophospholipase [Ruminococcus sp.]